MATCCAHRLSHGRRNVRAVNKLPVDEDKKDDSSLCCLIYFRVKHHSGRHVLIGWLRFSVRVIGAENDLSSSPVDGAVW